MASEQRHPAFGSSSNSPKTFFLEAEEEDEPELGPQRNDDEKPRSNILLKRLGKTNVIGTLRPVEYGRFGDRRATLVRMNFILRSPVIDNLRWIRGQVQVTFKPRISDTTTPRMDPEVVKFGPRKYFDIPSTETHERHYEIELSASGGGGVAQAGASARLGGSQSLARSFRLSIVGLPDKSDKTWNKVGWVIQENSSQKDGIPDELDIAMVVAYDHPFNAEVKVEVTTNHGITLFGWPWRADDPVFFDPPDPALNGPTPVTQFDQLTDEEWARMLCLHTQWQVCYHQ